MCFSLYYFSLLRTSEIAGRSIGASGCIAPSFGYITRFKVSVFLPSFNTFLKGREYRQWPGNTFYQSLGHNFRQLTFNQ